VTFRDFEEETMAEATENQGTAHHQTRRVVLGAAATLGMLAPAAPAALAATIGERRRGGPGKGRAGAPPEDNGLAPDAAFGARNTSEVWGASASGRAAGVRGNGRSGVVGEGTHTGVAGDGFIGVRGTTSIVRDDERGVGVWAQAVTPGSAALRADGDSEFNGVTKFSRSGVATVRRGSMSVTVTGVALASDSAILATLQHRLNDVYLHAVETAASGGSFTIFLTAAPAKDMTVAWFALG
jgi:hypothetical protein